MPRTGQVVRSRKKDGLSAHQLLFLSYYLSNGRRTTAAALKVGIDRRTAIRWLQPDQAVGRWLATEAELAFQGVQTIASERADLETLLVRSLLEGLASQDVVTKDKAAELTARILGLDRGGSEHDVSPATKALFAAMGVALVAVATGGEAAGLEGDGVRADAGCLTLPPGDGKD